jgi:hypothetical protein
VFRGSKMNIEEIDLYKDLIKIGVPGVIGLLAGLVPYLIERKKLTSMQDLEKLKAHQDLILQFTDTISVYIGSSSAYIAYLRSRDLNRGEKWNDAVSNAAKRMLEHEVERSKCKTLAGIIGNAEVLDKLVDYDQSVTTVLALLATNLHSEKDLLEEKILCMKEKEKLMLISFSNLKEQ